MNRILLIARNDLRLFLKERAALFWLFGAPLIFAYFMGMGRGPGSPANPRPALLIENRDAGFMGGLFIEELGVQGLRVIDPANGENAQRGLRIPTNFTASIRARQPVKVEFFQVAGSSSDAGALAEMRVVRALVAINSHLIEQTGSGTELTEDSMRAILRRENPLKLEASFGVRRPVPHGHNQAVPGVLVMFVLMNLLIFGGTSVASERREGVLRRFFVHPISKTELVYGKIAGLLGLGLVQIGFLLGAASLLMKFNLGAQFVPVIFLLLVYGWAAGSLGVLIGSLSSREDKIVGISVLFSMVMAAMGGCWWPLEIVPEKVRMIGQLSPCAWAMGALHQLLSFGGGWAEIRGSLLALGGFAIAANAAAVRFFRA